MALTILYTPPAFSSAQDDVIYTVSETVKTADPTTYPNYKFIADIYVNGTMVTRLKKVQDPVTGIGIFNIGEVIRNYVVPVFNPSPNVLVAQELGEGSFSARVQVKFGEEYAFTSFYNVTVDIPRRYYNNYNGRLKGLDSSLQPFANRVASGRPVRNSVFLNSTFALLSFFNTSTSAVPVKVTPVGGGSVYNTTFTPSDINNMAVLNLAPKALNALHPGTITAATRFYAVQIGLIVYEFEVICEPIYEPYTVHFLNKYGGFDTKIFSKVSRNTIKIDRKAYGKLRFQVGSDGIPSYVNSNGVYNESRSTYSSQFTEAMVLNSDLLTDEEYVWLQELVVSPMVYLQDGQYFFPCGITDTDYEPKQFRNDELTNLTINIEFGNQLNAQYR
jgi:hypothetical protein